MKLNHLNITVPNVAGTRHFFETCFNFTCVAEKGNNALVVLHDEAGFILTVMSESFNKNGLSAYPENFHFGFILDTKEEVSQLYGILKNAGIALEHEPGKIRNSFGFYFHFQNLFIKIGHYTDQITPK
ncbi:MAG TPA: VOC family protein [Flavobacterium sp.]|nr:VOC family protein [Flavobacterium sp.]